MRELGSPLERLFSTVPRQYAVKKVEDRKGSGTVTVEDAVGTVVLTVHVQSSNSGETCCIAVCGCGYTYHKEWDEALVTAKVAYGFYAAASTTYRIASLEAAALRELRKGYSPHRTPIPPAVTDAVDAVRELYRAARGEDVVRAWEEMRKVMGRLSRKGVTEEQLLKEWREALVREVQES
jgi:hypothetical protein